MKKLKRLRPSPAMTVAFLALFVAGAGTATATRLITGRQIKNSSITSTDVKNRSLLKKDFKSGQLPAGRQGAQGVAGRAGRDGFGLLSYQSGQAPVTGDGIEHGVQIGCPAGQYPTGGDAFVVDATDDVVPAALETQFFVNDTAGVPSGWGALYKTSTANLTIVLEAICANASQPPAIGAGGKRVGPPSGIHLQTVRPKR